MAKPTVSSVSELHNKTLFDFVAIHVEHEEDEPLNCELVDGGDGVIMVTKVSTASLLHQKLQVGDYPLTINDKPFKNKEELFKIASRTFPQLKLIVARSKSHTTSPTTSQSGNSVKSGKSPLGTPQNELQAPSEQPAKSISPHVSADLSFKSTTSISSSSSESDIKRKLTTKQMAAFKGFNVKPDHQYLKWRIETSKFGKTLGLGIMGVAKDHSVIISAVQPNSVTCNVFKPGDRFLAINNTTINDVHTCRRLIIETKGDFDVLIERPPNGLQAYGIEPFKPSASVQLQSSYSQPAPTNPDHALGNPFEGYEAAPVDVQAILTRQIPVLMKAFGTESAKSAQRGRSKSGERLQIEHNVHDVPISSDVAPGSVLRKPPKRA